MSSQRPMNCINSDILSIVDKLLSFTLELVSGFWDDVIVKKCPWLKINETLTVSNISLGWVSIFQARVCFGSRSPLEIFDV